MTNRLDVARGRDIVARWCNLAEQRLEHLTELFESGRWRRYHSERDFLENIQEAKKAVETWRDLLAREDIAVDISRLSQRMVLHSRAQTPPQTVSLAPQATSVAPSAVEKRQPVFPPGAEVIRLAPSEVPAALAVNASALPPAETSVDDAPEPALDPPAEPYLDVALMQRRYPLLRNAL
jgi:uncharacterized repeat protein (TIGR03809 family)